MWWLDAVFSGFNYKVNDSSIQYFRIVMGAACFIRFTLSFGHGGWGRFESNRLESESLIRKLGRKRFCLFRRFYRPVLFLRVFPAITLALGYASRWSAALALLSLLFERIYIKSPNSIRFATLMLLCILLSGNPGNGLSVNHQTSVSNTWAQWMGALFVVDLYWNSAWQKIRSQQFVSGLYLAQWMYALKWVKSRLRYPNEHAVPDLLLDKVGNLTPSNISLWRWVAMSVILLEVLLPVLLLIPETWKLAVFIGISMHIGFSCLKPRQLVLFTGTTVGSYILFLP